jgi:hypothetical protein
MACARAPAQERSTSTPAVEARLERGRPDFGVVVVRGVDEPGPAISVRVGDDADAPPLAGALTADGDSIRFVPRFALGDVGSLRVSVGGAEHRFVVPPPSVPLPSVRLTGISPSAAAVPENQLRWYLDFSGPMREGEASRHVTLVDGAGREVEGAFLTVEEELWDPSRRRLTLLFDMGRVKRGIRSRDEAGPPIVAGRDYAIVIDSAWRDARGAPLLHGTTHRFRVTAPDFTSPDPAAWRIMPPAAGDGALVVSLDGSIDRAMGERLVGVWRAGERVAGTTALDRADTRWTFAPATGWTPGRYELRVSAALEDRAGNSVARAFEVAAGVARAEGGEWISRWFDVPGAIAQDR